MLLMAAGSDDTRRARAEARADLIRRLFAVAISVGFAATLARMSWVQNGTLPNAAEVNQTLILATALLAAILGWDGHLLAMTDKPLFGFCRFLINLALVFIYMFLLMASAHPECLLWTLAVIFMLYVVWDVLTMRERISSYDPSLADVPRATAAQIRNVYAGGFAGGAHVSPGPAITLALDRLFRPARDHRKRTRVRPHPHDLRVRADRAGRLLDRRRPAAGRWRRRPSHAPADARHPGCADRGDDLFQAPARRVRRSHAGRRADGALIPPR
jgi:hypothetical protein